MGVDYFNCVNCDEITNDGGEVKRCEACEGGIGECCLYRDVLPECKACGCSHKTSGRSHKCTECDCTDHRCKKPLYHYSMCFSGGRTCDNCKCDHKSDKCDTGQSSCAGCKCGCDCNYSDLYVLCDGCRPRDREEEENDKDETDGNNALTIEEKAKGFDILVKRYELDEYEVLGKERPNEKKEEEEAEKPNKKRKRRYRRHELDEGLVTDSEDDEDEISLMRNIVMKYAGEDFVDTENKSRPGSYYFNLFKDEVKKEIDRALNNDKESKTSI